MLLPMVKIVLMASMVSLTSGWCKEVVEDKIQQAMEKLRIMTEWNKFFGAKNVFPDDINVIRCNPLDGYALYHELEGILANDTVVSTLYDRYRAEYNRNTENFKINRETFAKRLLGITEANVIFLLKKTPVYPWVYSTSLETLTEESDLDDAEFIDPENKRMGLASG